MSTIVVGFIDNPEGRHALDLAIEEASRRDARLIVAHSMPGGPRMKEREVIQYREALEAVESRLSGLGIDHEIHEYIRGNTPAEDLIEAVEEFDADLLVIGYRRRTATGKILLGSHAQEILMGVSIPVLAIVAPD
jgi:nucleotide-binding universal stress UspA family protein